MLHTREGLKRVVRIALAISVLALPLYSIYFFYLLNQSRFEARILRAQVSALNDEKKALGKKNAEAEEELRAKREALRTTEEKRDEAIIRWQEAKKAFDDFKQDLIDKPTFLKRGLGEFTSADRMSDWRKQIQTYRDQHDWTNALARAELVEASHRKAPSEADPPALLVVASLWKQVASLPVKQLAEFASSHRDFGAETGFEKLISEQLLPLLEESRVGFLPLVFRLKAAWAYQEAGASVSASGSTPGHVYGNAGINLWDIALDPKVRASEQLRFLKEAETLLRKAADAEPRNDAWKQRLISVTAKLMVHEPAKLRGFCQEFATTKTSRFRCGQALATSAHLANKRKELDLATYKDLVCYSLELAPEITQLKKECQFLSRKLSVQSGREEPRKGAGQ